MAVLHPDLSVDRTTAPVSLSDTGRSGLGLTIHGHITSSYHQLRDRLGQPDRRFTLHRNTGVWVLHTPAGRVNLGRWNQAVPASAGNRDVETRWAILAASDDVLPWIYKAVTGCTATFPTGAREHFSESTVETFANGYLDYLYLRMRAAETGTDRLDRDAPDFLTHLRRPRQLNSMALELAAVLHHYEWSQSSQAERDAWEKVGKPVPSPGPSDLHFWRQRNRWLYTPIKTSGYPHGGNPDLPGMLRGLADSARAHRPLLLDSNPSLDFALFDEHEQTLRALADTPIPGLDAVSFGG